VKRSIRRTTTGSPAGRATRRGALPCVWKRSFLARFPTLADLVVGLKLRLKRLSHIHLRMLWRLAERYGDAALMAAATRALEHRAFNAQAVRRILERTGAPPLPEAIALLTPSANTAALLGDVEDGSVEDYMQSDGGAADADQQEDEHE
jgi:hypothetical protein